MTIHTLHTLTVDGTTLALTEWDGIDQLRLSVAPIGKPSAVIELTREQALALARDVFRHAGWPLPEMRRAEPPAPEVDIAEESRLRHLAYGERAMEEHRQARAEAAQGRRGRR